MDKNKYQKKIQNYLKKRGTLKENSIKTYARNLAIIRDLSGYKKNDFFYLKDTDKIQQIVNDHYKTTSSKKTIYNSIFSVIKHSKLSSKAKDFYYNKMMEYKKILTKETDSNKMNESQKEKWTSWENINTVSDKIKEEMESLKLTNKRVKKKYYSLYKKYMVVLLYTKLPPLRLDYYKIKIFTHKTHINDENYLVINNDEVKLYLNDYKNVGKMGKVVLDYPDAIEDELRKWYNFKKENGYPTEYLFYSNHENKLFTSNSFGKFLTSIFKHYLKIPLTVNMLRHIYETELITSKDYNKMTIAQKEEQHKKLLHDFSTAQRYVKLDNFIKVYDGVKLPKQIDMKDTDKIRELLEQMGIEVN